MCEAVACDGALPVADVFGELLYPAGFVWGPVLVAGPCVGVEVVVGAGGLFDPGADADGAPCVVAALGAVAGSGLVDGAGVAAVGALLAG